MKTEEENLLERKNEEELDLENEYDSNESADDSKNNADKSSEET